MHILEAAHQNKVKRFLFSTSAAVYGPQEEPCHEKMRCKPDSPYGHSKLLGEKLCAQYWQNYDLETVCLRYFNVFGERQNLNGAYAAVVATFKNCMEQNKPITIFGDGTQTRDFIPVEKVVEANIQLALAEKENVVGQIFNIATGKSINLLELIEQLKKELPIFSGNVTFLPARKGDIKHSQAQCTKYKNILSIQKEY